MKKPIIIALLLLSSSLMLKAQDQVKPKAQPDSIIRVIPAGEGRDSFYLYTIGGKLQTREDVAIRLMAYAPSAKEYHAFRNNLTWTYVSFGGLAITSLAAGIEYGQNTKLAGATAGFVNGEPAIIYQHHNLTPAYVLTGMATAFLASSIINLSKALFHGKNAIKVYNQRFE